MDTIATALCRVCLKESVPLSILLVLCFSLTGCETLQSSSSASNAYRPPSTPAPTTQAPATHPQPATTAQAPTPTPAAPPVEKPPTPPTPPTPAEPQHATATVVRPPEPKPAAPTTPPKGAETLVALSTPAQARSNAPAPARAPAVSAPKREASAVAVAPQPLILKGPERPPAGPSHKLLWLGVGFGLCAVAGGGLTLASVTRRRKVTESFPVGRPEDEISLPSEFKMREPRAYVEEEPVATDKGSE